MLSKDRIEKEASLVSGGWEVRKYLATGFWGRESLVIRIIFYEQNFNQKEANVDYKKKSQLDTMQKSTDCGEPSPSGYIYTTGSPINDSGTIAEEGAERL